MGSHSEFENYTLATELEELTSGFPLFPCMHEDAYIRLVSLGGSCQRLPLWVNIRRNVFDMINIHFLRLFM